MDFKEMLRNNKENKAKKGNFQPIETMIAGNSKDEGSDDRANENGIEDIAENIKDIAENIKDFEEGVCEGENTEGKDAPANNLEILPNDEGKKNSTQNSNTEYESSGDCNCDNGKDCNGQNSDCCDAESKGDSDKDDSDKGDSDNKSDAESESKFKVCEGVLSIKEEIDYQIEDINISLEDINEELYNLKSRTKENNVNFKKLDTYVNDSLDKLKAELDKTRADTDKEFEEIEKLIKTTGAASSREIKIKIGDAKPKVYKAGHTHEKFDLVLSFLINKIPTLLTGPAGTGKSFMARQIAEANNWDYYFSNQITEEYKLTGFINATGEYQSTPFYEAFTKGGLFFIDEIDASIPEALIILNMAIANREFAFPHGNFKAHEDFRIMAAGNTIAGANSDYTGRSKLDKASLDRFSYVEVNYDNVLEENLLTKPVFDLIMEMRDFVGGTRKINALFSMRAGLYYDNMKSAGLDTVELVRSILLRGLDVNDFKSFGKSMESKKEVYKVRRAIYEILGEEMPEEEEKRIAKAKEERRKKEAELRKKGEEALRKDTLEKLGSDSMADLRQRITTHDLTRLNDNDVRLVQLWERFGQD